MQRQHRSARAGRKRDMFTNAAGVTYEVDEIALHLAIDQKESLDAPDRRALSARWRLCFRFVPPCLITKRELGNQIAAPQPTRAGHFAAHLTCAAR